jgi:hydroxymethylglutaryl-CoA lyase
MARVRDVTLRDVMQSLPVVVPTAAKVALYRELLAAGIEEAQVTSFVSPKRLPQLADAEALWRALGPLPGVKSALIANARGYQRARAIGGDRLEMVLAISTTYHRNNSGRAREETWAEIAEMAPEANASGVYLAIVLSNAWHCHFEGETPRKILLHWADRVAKLEVPEVGLADTTGAAQPEEVYRRVHAVRNAFPHLFVRVHLHEGGAGLDNLRAALDAGADGFDAAVLGLGGSPFAGEMVGNLDHRRLCEDGLVDLDLDRLGRAEEMLKRHLSDGEPVVRKEPGGERVEERKGEGMKGRRGQGMKG